MQEEQFDEFCQKFFKNQKKFEKYEKVFDQLGLTAGNVLKLSFFLDFVDPANDLFRFYPEDKQRVIEKNNRFKKILQKAHDDISEYISFYTRFYWAYDHDEVHIEDCDCRRCMRKKEQKKECTCKACTCKKDEK